MIAVVDQVEYNWNDMQRATNRHLKNVLPKVMGRIGARYRDRPDLVMAAWSELVGPKLAPHALAEKFVDGVLMVRVAHSPLYSVLKRDRGQLERRLRERFPKTTIHGIRLRVG